MKIAIVGGGITGCAIAYFLANLDHEVNLYEQSDRLGGILKDSVKDNECFFNACQYLSTDAEWLIDIRKELEDSGCKLIDFSHNYGSWNNFYGEQLYQYDFAGPVIESSLPNLDNEVYKATNLEDRFKYYGEDIYPFLIKSWIRCGHSPNKIHDSCATALQMARVFVKSDIHKLKKQKNELIVADGLLGLPRSMRNNENILLTSCLPQNGYNDFFNHFHKVLIKNKVNIFTNSKINIQKDNENKNIPRLFMRKQALKYDLLVWCCNPIRLINLMINEKLSNPIIKTICVHGNLNIKTEFLPFYIQCFSSKSCLYRIYIYALGNKSKVCIECFDAIHFSASEVTKSAENILSQSGIKATITPLLVEHQNRHIIFSPNDFKLLSEFDDISHIWKIVGSAWEIYGRDAKIDKIKLKIKELFF